MSSMLLFESIFECNSFLGADPVGATSGAFFVFFPWKATDSPSGKGLGNKFESKYSSTSLNSPNSDPSNSRAGMRELSIVVRDDPVPSSRFSSLKPSMVTQTIGSHAISETSKVIVNN